MPVEPAADVSGRPRDKRRTGGFPGNRPRDVSGRDRGTHRTVGTGGGPARRARCPAARAPVHAPVSARPRRAALPAWLFFAALALAPALPARAQTPEEAAAQNLSLAVHLCLSNYFDAAGFADAFRQAGFTLSPSLDPGSFEIAAPGISGIIVPEDFNNYCTMQSTRVPLARGAEIARQVARRDFGDKVAEGHPENQPTACPMLSIFAPRRLILVETLSAGNAGGCGDPTSTGIVIR